MEPYAGTPHAARKELCRTALTCHFAVDVIHVPMECAAVAAEVRKPLTFGSVYAQAPALQWF